MLQFSAVNTYAQNSESTPETCEQLLDWIYKEITIQNLENSIERTKKKLLASMISSMANNTTGKLKNKIQLAKLWKSMKDIDPKFEAYLEKNTPYKKFNRYTILSQIFGATNPEDLESYSFFNAINEWKKLQAEKPEYFKGMDKRLFLDEWDIATAKLVDEIGKVQYQNTTQLNEIQKLSKELKSIANNKSKDIVTDNVNLIQINYDLEKIQRKIMNKIKDIYSSNQEEYSKICSEEKLNSLISANPDHYVCPIPNQANSSFLEIQTNLDQIANLIPKKDLNLIYKPEIPEDINTSSPSDEVSSAVDQLCPIKFNYMKVRQPSAEATYNMRNVQMIDTVVIHHTGPGSNLKTNVEAIHNQHIDRSTDGDAWYMVGYNYLINLGGNGGSVNKPNIVVGRDTSFRGAHAGGNTLPLSIKEIEKLFNTYQFYNCKEVLENVEVEPYKVHTKSICEDDHEQVSPGDYRCGALASNIASLNNDGSISGNLTTIGVAVMGNFTKESTKSINGIDLYDHNLTNIKDVQYSLVPKLVELINALKKDYPTIKRIVPHSYFKSTECPGQVRNILTLVAQKTGLELQLSKSNDIRQNGYPNRNDKNYNQYLSIVKQIAKFQQDVISLNTQAANNNIKIQSGKLTTNEKDRLLKENKALLAKVESIQVSKVLPLIKKKDRYVPRGED